MDHWKWKTTEKNSFIFCPYCEQVFLVDDEKKEQVITKNININNVVTKRYIDDTKISKETLEAKKGIAESIIAAILVIFMLLLLGAMAFFENVEEKKAIDSGLISAGYYEDFQDENYEVVVSQFESMGFENIETIDLDDAGWFKNKKDTVKMVSIGGKTNFSSSDYFSKTAQVIISYH